MKIEYPTPQEQHDSIERIVKYGLPQRSAFAELREMFRSLGPRVIFYGQGDVMFIAAMAVAFIAYYLVQLACQPGIGKVAPEYLYSFLFTVSPTMYLLLCLLGFWKEKLSTVYDIKMTCKYTVCHLAVFRMLAFSCANIVVNMLTAGLCCLLHLESNFWRMFMVSASGLFLLSVLLIYSLLFGRGIIPPTVVSVVWVPANLLCNALAKDTYWHFLRVVPLPLHIAVTAALACLYIFGLKRLFLRKKEKVLC